MKIKQIPLILTSLCSLLVLAACSTAPVQNISTPVQATFDGRPLVAPTRPQKVEGVIKAVNGKPVVTLTDSSFSLYTSLKDWLVALGTVSLVIGMIGAVGHFFGKVNMTYATAGIFALTGIFTISAVVVVAILKWWLLLIPAGFLGLAAWQWFKTHTTVLGKVEADAQKIANWFVSLWNKIFPPKNPPTPLVSTPPSTPSV